MKAKAWQETSLTQSEIREMYKQWCENEVGDGAISFVSFAVVKQAEITWKARDIEILEAKQAGDKAGYDRAIKWSLKVDEKTLNKVYDAYKKRLTEAKQVGGFKSMEVNQEPDC